jgi:cell volume regulation protein A
MEPDGEPVSETTLVFGVVAGIIIIGFAGELLFRRTGVPVFIFLILTGIILGPVFNILPRSPLIPSLAIFAELTLLMVLFYAGMDTKAAAAMEGAGRAFVQVILYVGISTAAIGLFGAYVLGWGLIQSLILGSMIGGETTAAVVVPLSRGLKLPDVTVAYLTLESAMNSIFSIILFFAFVAIYMTGTGDIVTTLSMIASNFSVGIVIGGLFGLGAVSLLHRLQAMKYTYVLTLGLVFTDYALTEELGGSGELGVLIFGIILGNYSLLNYITKRHWDMEQLQRQLGIFQDEISFLIETLFFVFLGLTFEIAPASVVDNLGFGIAALVILLAVRYFATSVSTFRSELSEDKRAIWLMCAQGLVPATLAIIALNLQLPLSNSFLNIVTYVIVLTNAVTAVGSVLRRRAVRTSTADPMKELGAGSKLT